MPLDSIIEETSFHYPRIQRGTFLLQSVETGSEIHPVSYSVGPGGKATGAWSWPVCQINNDGSVSLRLPIRLRRVLRDTLDFLSSHLFCIKTQIQVEKYTSVAGFEPTCWYKLRRIQMWQNLNVLADTSWEGYKCGRIWTYLLVHIGVGKCLIPGAKWEQTKQKLFGFTSVCIILGYRLDDRGIGVWFPAQF
jgi:hypothetical protein